MWGERKSSALPISKAGWSRSWLLFTRKKNSTTMNTTKEFASSKKKSHRRIKWSWYWGKISKTPANSWIKAKRKPKNIEGLSLNSNLSSSKWDMWSTKSGPTSKYPPTAPTSTCPESPAIKSYQNSPALSPKQPTLPSKLLGSTSTDTSIKSRSPTQSRKNSTIWSLKSP